MNLWVYCFWLEFADCEKHGREKIVIADVEKRVIELSKILTEYPIPDHDRQSHD